MTDSNDERSPGFKKSLIGKLITLGIFVAFGTAAVGWSMRACKICQTDEASAAAESENDLQASSPNGSDPSEPVEKLQLQQVSTSAANSGFAPRGSNFEPAKPADNPKVVRQASSQFAPPVTNVTPANNGAADNGFDPSAGGRVTTQRPAAQPPEPRSFGPPRLGIPQLENPAAQNNSFPAATDKPRNAPPKLNPPAETGRFTDRFQQPTDPTGDFVNQAADDVKDKAGDFGELTDNSLRQLSEAKRDAKQELLGPEPPKTNLAPIVNPSGNQDGGPPITPRTTFDTSRNLQPFDPTANQVSPPPNDNRDPPIRQPFNNAPPVTPMVRPVTQAASSANPSPANSLTRPTPGERALEGMQSPSVTIEKIAPSEIQLNTLADFELVVKNTGRVVANQVRVVDQIPVGSDLVEAVPQPSRGAGNQISWELDSLEPGQEKRIRIQLRPTTTGEIGSVAQVTFAAQASMRTKVTKPVLSIEHTIDPRVLIGDTVVLNIEVKNEGDGAAGDVIIQEDLPEGLEFSEGFRELEYAIGTLGPGQSKKIRLELQAAKIGKYRNILVAHADGGLQTQHAADMEVIAPQLVATGDGPTKRFLGREATHRFAVRNTGTAPATNVELVCRLPNGLKFIDTNNRGRYDKNSHAVYWSLAEIAPGIVANVELSTTPTEPGTQDLNFEAAADLGQSATAVCKLAVEHLVDVFFDIVDLVDPIEVGTDTAYRLRIVNQGTKTATNVQLAIEFPPGLAPTAVEGNITSEIRGQQIAFSPITSMNPGDEIELTVKARGVTPGDHRVSVNLNADGREVNVSKQESTRVYSDR